jgi:hypothetical protein
MWSRRSEISLIRRSDVAERYNVPLCTIALERNFRYRIRHKVEIPFYSNIVYVKMKQL